MVLKQYTSNGSCLSGFAALDAAVDEVGPTAGNDTSPGIGTFASRPS